MPQIIDIQPVVTSTRVTPVTVLIAHSIGYQMPTRDTIGIPRQPHTVQPEFINMVATLKIHRANGFKLILVKMFLLIIILLWEEFTLLILIIVQRQGHYSVV